MLLYLLIPLVFLAVPIIALADYVLFSRFARCENCGYKERDIWVFLPATFIEVLLFLGGVAVGILWGV
jgi:hypothetical protein